MIVWQEHLTGCDFWDVELTTQLTTNTISELCVPLMHILEVYLLAVDVKYSLMVFAISLGSVSSCSPSTWVLCHVDTGLEDMSTTDWDCWCFLR